MALLSGARLGPYEIVAPLGQGGMGEVYRARDTKLNREVALKVLPDRVQSASFALFSASLVFLEGCGGTLAGLGLDSSGALQSGVCGVSQASVLAVERSPAQFCVRPDQETLAA